MGQGILADVYTAIRPEPAWLTEARRYLGLRETAGPGNTPAILAWAKSFGGWVASFFVADATPWCGLFVGHCLMVANLRNMPKNPLAALSWLTYGVPLAEPALGCLAVFARNGGGHVGFYLGEHDGLIRVLGGNQHNDSVSIDWVKRERLRGYRWPAEIEKPPLPSLIELDLTGAVLVSTDEA